MSDLRLLASVFDDTAGAAEWYDDQHLGLGDRFLDAFYAALPKIAQGPLLYHPVYREFRRILLKPFPYSAYFRIHEETVIVTLVFHAARNPQTLQRILQRRQKSTQPSGSPKAR